MEQRFITMLINDYDQLLKLPHEAYDWVIPSLKQLNLKRGTVIKKQATADKVSRYLCQGFIGSYREIAGELKLFSLFKATDTVFDETSFRSGFVSETVLKAISDVVFLEFPTGAEIVLLDRHSRFTLLAHKVAHRITERNGRVHAISRMGIYKGYEKLMFEFPGLEAEITNADLADFFGVHTRTVERWKHNLKTRGHG